ncbi:hypothetical protein [Paraburkholderia sp. LEh10]|uniref:hypothetical protein n=1 Tax=Paraburkholderia sp. LEh10 TaxID=2821353 RepID=UPI001FD7EFB0|nr:hypothetical protein [Paraburkholderia sp. LEh10]
MDTLNIGPRAIATQPTRKTVEYLYATTALGLRIAHADAATDDPSLRWFLLEYRIDEEDIGRELSRYVSVSAPKAIVEARRVLADTKAVHLEAIEGLEIDLDDAQARWTNACRQKLQALRVKLTDMRARTAPDAHELNVATDGSPGATEALAPHFFIYLAPDDLAARGGAPAFTASASQSQLRARNYVGSWLLEENVDVDVSGVARCGWPLPAFQRWIHGLATLRRKPSRDEDAPVPGDCVFAAGNGHCLVMDLPTFSKRYPPQGK